MADKYLPEVMKNIPSAARNPANLILYLPPEDGGIKRLICINKKTTTIKC